MSQGETEDPEVSAALAEYMLMSELPGLTPDIIDAMDRDRVARYVALAEVVAERRAAARRR